MRNIENSPVASPALESTLLAQLSGSFISNQPKKLTAKTTSKRKRKMLKTELVERALSVLGPKAAVTRMPSPR